MSRNIRKQKKVLLMGLSNSGKTSILLSLKENTNLLSYLSLKPTKGLKIERFEEIDYDLNIWDMGGQDQYREDYLNSFYKYTTGISKLIYVIDIQAIDKYELSLEYLQNIMSLLERDHLIIEISVFLHKFDPNLEKREKFKDIGEIVNNQLVDKISQIISLDYDYEIFKTSIYTVFEKNLVKRRGK